MPEGKRNVERTETDMRLEGFEQIFDETAQTAGPAATASGEAKSQGQTEKLLERLTDLTAFSADQRIENARLASQIIENQQQLIATQQILIRLMEKSIELTRHIAAIEEKLPVVFELPRIVESLKDRVIRLEGIEID
jgi:hypothetical protein